MHLHQAERTAACSVADCVGLAPAFASHNCGQGVEFFGVLLGVVFAVVVIGFVYGLLFVSQPMEQAPNDKEFISLMATIVTFLSGTLAGIVASNGMKNKPK